MLSFRDGYYMLKIIFILQQLLITITTMTTMMHTFKTNPNNIIRPRSITINSAKRKVENSYIYLIRRHLQRTDSAVKLFNRTMEWQEQWQLNNESLKDCCNAFLSCFILYKYHKFQEFWFRDLYQCLKEEKKKNNRQRYNMSSRNIHALMTENERFKYNDKVLRVLLNVYYCSWRLENSRIH